MNFAEFLLEEESFEFLYESALDESLWDMIAGGAQAFNGAMIVPDEALAKLMGDGTKGRMSKGFRDIRGGLGRAFFGRQATHRSAPQPQPSAVSAADIRAVAEEFKRLTAAFYEARKRGDKNLARRIAGRMRRIDPASFAELEAQSRAAKKERNRRKWSFLDSNPTQKPEDFLSRLAAEQ